MLGSCPTPGPPRGQDSRGPGPRLQRQGEGGKEGAAPKLWRGARGRAGRGLEEAGPGTYNLQKKTLVSIGKLFLTDGRKFRVFTIFPLTTTDNYVIIVLQIHKVHA